jgi:hypothetical protein
MGTRSPPQNLGKAPSLYCVQRNESGAYCYFNVFGRVPESPYFYGRRGVRFDGEWFYLYEPNELRRFLREIRSQGSRTWLVPQARGFDIRRDPRLPFIKAWQPSGRPYKQNQFW